jgi:hypothetical protein
MTNLIFYENNTSNGELFESLNFSKSKKSINDKEIKVKV